MPPQVSLAIISGTWILPIKSPLGAQQRTRLSEARIERSSDLHNGLSFAKSATANGRLKRHPWPSSHPIAEQEVRGGALLNAVGNHR